ncbi:universal stress protein [Nonomuraea sp. NPDC050556]|uniref:universal stress protein n=1 Tax=Nonomuraea sp. NPDC050556 TaxID=3364369 RepID=UPI0037A60F95
MIETLNQEPAGADSVVVGSRGLGGFTGLVPGSVSLGVAGHASGPVVVVGFDGSPGSEPAMAYGIEQARACGARLHVVYAWRAPISSAVSEHPVFALANASRTAELAVVGSRGLGGFAAAVLGSVGHGVLHHAHCPVAVVRPRGEVR